jgi:hypothetical protein
VFGFPYFCQLVIVHSIYTVFPCSPSDSDTPYDILDLANVFLANSIPQSVVMHLKVLISVVLSRHLVMLVLMA